MGRRVFSRRIPVPAEKSVVEQGDGEAVERAGEEHADEAREHAGNGQDDENRVKNGGREPLRLERMEALDECSGRGLATFGDERNCQHEQAGDDKAGHDAECEADRGRHSDQERDEQQIEPAVGVAEDVFNARRARGSGGRPCGSFRPGRIRSRRLKR